MILSRKKFGCLLPKRLPSASAPGHSFLADGSSRGPSNTVAPSVAGTGLIGFTLTATPGTWPDADTVTANWQRGGADMAGETGDTYVIAAGDIGFTITYRETAANGDGVRHRSSNSVVVATAPVANSFVMSQPSVIVTG